MYDVLLTFSRDPKVARAGVTGGNEGRIATRWAQATALLRIALGLVGLDDSEVQYSPFGSFCMRAYRRRGRVSILFALSTSSDSGRAPLLERGTREELH